MKMACAAAILVLSLIPCFAQAVTQEAVESPQQAFGFAPGTDRKLADWNQLTAYYQKLAQESPRVRYADLGKTTEGRPFVALTISSAQNMTDLAQYQEINRRLADPRITTPEDAKALIAKGKTILLLTFNIHSSEIASSQTAAQFAYQLAADNSPEVQAILNNVIFLLIPSLNPDGEQIVVDWYKKYLGTPFEGSDVPYLWAHYVGHDDNRDWVGFTQAETRHAVKLINEWRPQILYDLHQMGANGPRIYLPPWVNPVDPNVDPLLVTSMNGLGARTAAELASSGQAGVLINGVYDFWSPLRDYIAYHNGLRILTESASVNIATPIQVPFEQLGRGIGYDAKVASWNFPDPWKGGTWTLGDIVHDQLIALFSIARSASLDRERFLTDFYAVGSHAVHPAAGPFAYVVPPEQSDPVAAARLINLLRTADVEVEQSQGAFEADGKAYPAGTYIVRLDQPYRGFAKTVLEIQHYPEIREYPGGPLQRPYDVTAHTLPLLLGVRAVAIEHSFQTAAKPVTSAAPPPGHVDAAHRNGYLLDDSTNSSLYALFDLLKAHVRAYRLTGSGYPPGTIYVPEQAGVQGKLQEAARRLSVQIRAPEAAVRGKALGVTLPRIGVYQSWVPSMDEGWTRFLFDQNAIPYRRLVDAQIRQGKLRQSFDVIVLPDNAANAILNGRSRQGGDNEGSRVPSPPLPPEYLGGLGEAGAAALTAFVQSGGTIVTLNKASEVYAKQGGGAVSNVLQGVANKDFYVPGSILQVAVDTSDPIGFGSPATVPVFFENGPSFKISDAATSVARYTSDNPLLSGWLLGGKYLNGTSAIAVEPQGKGRIVLFGFRPQYRGLSEVTYKLFLNALLESSSTPASL